jgi:hypothetical protein
MKAADRFFVDGVSCVFDGQQLSVANLSMGGLFAATDRPPALGQVVRLDLTLGKRAPFPVVGRVTWVNDPADSRAPGMPRGFGIKITEIAFPDKLAIVHLLKRSPARTARVGR